MDKTVKEILDREIKRQDTTIELIASENYASQAKDTTMVALIWMK